MLLGSEGVWFPGLYFPQVGMQPAEKFHLGSPFPSLLQIFFVVLGKSSDLSQSQFSILRMEMIIQA